MKAEGKDGSPEFISIEGFTWSPKVGGGQNRGCGSGIFYIREVAATLSPEKSSTDYTRSPRIPLRGAAFRLTQKWL
jgi:hypothetical protein